MAVVTLKDLMDPLTKIAKSTEETASKLDAVVAAVTGGAGNGGQLSAAIVTELKVQTDLLRQIASSSKTSALSIGGKNVDKDKLKEGAEAIKMLGAGASSLAFGLLAFILVPKGAIKKFSTIITDIMAVFNEIDGKKVKEGAEAFQMIADSISKFARGLAMASILLIPGYLGAVLLKSVLMFLLPTFEMMGDKEKGIRDGAEVLGLMGDSLVKFAKGLVLVAISSIVGLIMSPVIILTMILFAGAFTLLGKFDMPIRKGARALLMMGRALVFFSIGLVTFALASLFILIKPVILLAMVGTLVIIGGAFALLGIFSNPIKKGAVALVIMGISLVLFSIGFLIFAMVTKDMTLERIGVQAAIIGGLGLAFGLAGKMFTSIIKGTIGIAAMGIGLLIFSLGYLPFAYVTKDMTMDDVGIQSGILLALGLEFVAAGLGVVPIILGAAAFSAVGVSLAVLAGGLAAWKAVGFTESDATAMTTALAGIRVAFLGSSNAEEGFFAKLGGALTGAIDSVKMIEAAAGFSAAGLSLILLSKGLTAFKSVGWSDELSKELTIMLNGVTTAFALAGSEKQVPSTSFFGQMFGFKASVVTEGIRSVMGAGRALNDIVKGLIGFQSLIKSGVNFGTPDGNGNYAPGTLGYAVVNTVGFIRTAFAAVANEGNVQGGGFFNTLFGIKQNKVQEGINSVQGVGSELKNIAEGIKSFQTLVSSGINFGTPDGDGNYAPGTLGYAVVNTVGFISNAFAAVADKGNVKAGGFFGSLFGIEQNKVQEGISSVKGVGEELINIASGIKSFKDMIDQQFDFPAIGQAIATTLTLIGDAFAIVGGKEQTDSSFFGVITWDENLVKKGIDNVDGAGKKLMEIGEGLKAFQQLTNPEQIANSIKSIFTSIGDTFTFYYDKPKFKSQVDHMQGFISEISRNAERGFLHKAADGLEKMAAAINKIDTDKAEAFASLFKGAGELSSNEAAYTQLISAVEDIRDALGVVTSGMGTTSPAPVEGTPGGGGGGVGDTASFAGTLRGINATLSTLNGTLSNLPSSIQQIQIKIEDPSGTVGTSDIRLKKNLIAIGVSSNRINIYEFEYIDEFNMPGRYQGVIAQELIGTPFENALILNDGYYSVDYSKIDVEFKKML